MIRSPSTEYGQETSCSSTLPSLKGHTMNEMKQHNEVELDTEVDVFPACVDSLMAIQLRRCFHRNLEVGCISFASNAVEDARNTFRLSRLHAYRSESSRERQPAHEDG